METINLINTVAAYLRGIVEQSYTICPVNMVAPIVTAGAALGLCICGGQYDPETQTRVLYIDAPKY